MTRRTAPLLRLAICLLLAVGIAYVTFSLAWSPTPRFVVAITPGVYIATALNRLFRLPTNGAGIWYLFFMSHVLFWFALLFGTTWAAGKVWSRRHQVRGEA